ncbi:MAG TPA: signal peptide peptidase SppA [Candidatus Sulfopaludibacter sp.]|jgi:protease-4|nr:signal peptide peptidase SppA [Candidatus Sulfopaludibacter sp.]
MAKFLIGVVTGIVLVFLTVILLFFAALRFREKPPQIADNSVLVLRLQGDIPEKPPVELPAFLGRGPGITIANVWTSLRKAAADPHIKAVVLELESLAIGWAKSQELRADLEQFRKSGKPVYAYLRTPGMHDYYVALAADRIYVGPSDQMYIKGLRAEMMYFKKTLDKLGVTVQVEHAGKYKDFGDMFTRPDMSPETREQVGAVVDGIYGDIVTRIASARKKSPDDVRTLIDQGPYTALQAQKAGLVDELRFEDEMYGELKSALKSGDLKKVGIESYVRVPADSVGLGGRSRIAFIVGQGDIVRGSSDDDGTEENLTSYGFGKMVRQVAADSNVKGVIVRIDSPGGEVTASDEMWREMNLLSKKKPVVISMSDVAASGGYYMVMTGDPILAYPDTETGSIGVVFGKPDLHGLYDKLGITKEAVQRGRHADIDSDYSALTPEEAELLRKGIDESYQDFVSKVATARHRKFDQIEPLAQGRVWIGSDAQPRGLVDQLGGLDSAVQMIKEKAHIPANENVNIDFYPQSRSLLDILTKRSQPDALDAKLKQVLGSFPFRAWMQGGYLRMMPYWPVIR